MEVFQETATWSFTWKSTDLKVGGIDCKVLNPFWVQLVVWFSITSRNPHKGHLVAFPENIKHIGRMGFLPYKAGELEDAGVRVKGEGGHVHGADH